MKNEACYKVRRRQTAVARDAAGIAVRKATHAVLKNSPLAADLAIVAIVLLHELELAARREDVAWKRTL